MGWLVPWSLSFCVCGCGFLVWDLFIDEKNWKMMILVDGGFEYKIFECLYEIWMTVALGGVKGLVMDLLLRLSLIFSWACTCFSGCRHGHGHGFGFLLHDKWYFIGYWHYLKWQSRSQLRGIIIINCFQLPLVFFSIFLEKWIKLSLLNKTTYFFSLILSKV